MNSAREAIEGVLVLYQSRRLLVRSEREEVLCALTAAIEARDLEHGKKLWQLRRCDGWSSGDPAARCQLTEKHPGAHAFAAVAPGPGEGR